MATLLCPGCSKRYRVDRDPAGKVVRCPACGVQLEYAADVPLRQQLKHEMARLSTVDGTEGADESAGARIRVAEPTRRRIGRWILLGALVLALAGTAGGCIWAYAHAHARAQEAPPELGPEVKAALTKAQRSDVPGQEDQALADWRAARGTVVDYRIRERVPDAFQEEVDRADERIRQLQAAIRQRQANLQTLQKALNEAQATFDAGRVREAATALEALLAAIPKADVPEADRAWLLAATESMLALARVTTPATRATAPSSPTRTSPRVPAPGAAPAPPARTEALVLDGPGDVLAWRAEAWANPATLSLEPGAAVTVRQTAGTSDKWALSMNRSLDVRGYGTLALEVESVRPTRLAVALWTGAGGRAMFESPTETARGGGWHEVSFALKGPRFKSQETNWQFGTELKDGDSVARVALILYDSSQTPLRIRNVRLTP